MVRREAAKRTANLTQREQQLQEGEQILVTLSARLINEQEALDQQKKSTGAATSTENTELTTQV